MTAKPRSIVRMEAERFLAVLIILLVLFVFLWIKPQTVVATWEEQQMLTARWIGAGANTMAFDMVHGLIHALYEWTYAKINGIQDISVNRWMAERLYVFVAWISIVLYRAAALLYIGLYFVPIILVAALDGLFTREIRKTSFVAQSPVMHKLGLYTVRLFVVVSLVWLMLPYGVPASIVPAAAFIVTLSVWAWAANLQKRI